ncbi:D-alanyl-D-alanine carboxypeptidase [Microbacterium sp. BWT-B31]|uniref:D-alanyl-D-alanine carboxypeptidase family protein n=1 Tax=Microbacterium sp. BWT-B31 TaxID=3232072 RepID=UPI003527F6D1
MTTTPGTSDALEDLAALLGAEQPDDVGQPPVDPARRRARRRRGLIITAAIVAGLLLLTGGYTGWALTAPLSDPVAATGFLRAPEPALATIALPTQGASAISVTGADEYLGPSASGIWLASGDDESRPIASITKLITALVVLDAHPLTSADDPGPTLTFGKADHALYDKYYVMGASIAPMPTGTTMSLHDALATMLIPSACNYAEAIAGWAFGSQWGFLDAAQRWLDAHGLARTTIVEPTGIDERNTSTPSDLIAIGRIAAADPVIAKIVATPAIDFEATGWMPNTNTLLGTAGVTGLKTGTLGPNSSNLLYTATLDVGIGQPLTVVGVVLGGASRDTVDRSAQRLLDSIRSGFTTVPLAERGQEVGSYSTPWGQSARMVLGAPAEVLTWSDTPISVEMQTVTPEAWEDGVEVGTATWTAGPNSVTVPIVIEGTITPPTPWWRLTHPDELG